jgi:uncharacterized protein (DUF58 family)
MEFGTESSARRGPGSDVAGSRPYRPGDRLSSVDWYASARLSAMKGEDEFIVRQTYAEHAPRVTIVCDRRPSMGLYGPELPFLHKPRAVREAVAAILASARAAHAGVGWLDVGTSGATWLPPRADVSSAQIERRLNAGWDAPVGSLDRALGELTRRRTEAPQGTFVFVISDFTTSIDAAVWRPLAARGLDLVPVIVQDPVWEASFPDVAGVVLPFADAEGRHAAGVRLTGAETRLRRSANEERARDVRQRLRSLGADVVTLAASDTGSVDAAFGTWAARRRALRRPHVRA